MATSSREIARESGRKRLKIEDRKISGKRYTCEPWKKLPPPLTTKPSTSQLDEIGCPSVRSLCCIGMAEPEDGGEVAPPEAAAATNAAADSSPPAKKEEPAAAAEAKPASAGEGVSLNYEVRNI